MPGYVTISPMKQVCRSLTFPELESHWYSNCNHPLPRFAAAVCLKFIGTAHGGWMGMHWPPPGHITCAMRIHCKKNLSMASLLLRSQGGTHSKVPQGGHWTPPQR